MASQTVARLVGVVVSCVLCLPALVSAQSETGNIAGVVRDASGAVLPGVTVEAASPALIEKVRVVVSNGEGLYRIVDLRPGVYSVTFTLPGFNTFVREGITLGTGFTATVNGEMKVGGVEETITVTGEAPLVDTQNVQQQVTLSRDLLDEIPTSRRPAQFITLIVGADGGANASTLHDVGGVGSDRAFFGVHGQRADDMTYNFGGMDSRVFSGGGFQYNAHTFEEVVVETAAGSAEATTGGVQVNIVPKDGGNMFSGTMSTEITGPSLQAENLNDKLRARGLTKAGAVRRYYDVGGGVGGPIKQDKLWFFSAARWEDRSLYQAGNYYNKLQGTVFYEPDLSRPAYNHDYSKDASIRLTWQAAAKHKIVGMYTHHPSCQCTFALLEQISPIFAPEAVAEHHYDGSGPGQLPQFLATGQYTFPATNRLLIEADWSQSAYHRNQARIPGVGYDAISVTDTGLNLRYGSRSTFYQILNDDRIHERAAVSYITGTHNFKAGVDLNQMRQGRKSYDDPFIVNHAISYTFRNQLPVSVSIYTGPYGPYQTATENGFYAQDQWTMRRLTMNLGLRYSVYDVLIPESHLPAGPYVPARDFPEVKHSPRWENLSPRVGAAYDLFGTGKTALKVALGRYPARNTGVGVNLPVSNQPTSTTMAWNDANGNFVPDCVLTNPLANGECGAWSDRTFGQIRQGNTRYADDARGGYNLENYNWQGNVSVQHQLASNLGLTVAYFRTWYGGFQVLDNERVTPADFDPFCITAPVDSRLPGSVSGKQFCGNYDVNPSKFGQNSFLRTQASHYGNMSEVFDGVDLTVAARFGRGGQVQGGMATGRTVTDNCGLVVDSPSTVTAGTPAGAALALPVADMRPGFCNVSRPWSSSTQVKFSVVYPLPWGLQASSIYQNIPGVPIRASYVATDAEIRPSLGRHLAACPSQTAATCNQTVTIDLIPPFSLYGDRIQQVDLRLTRNFPLGARRLQGNFDVYNVLNANTVQNEQSTYRTGANNQWRNAIQVMGGRLFKFSAQLTF
ncbi:MAG: TonB-dependent receptor [Acidobacteria bacterium]|nr:TonB-dependent receptor [Acidobacteriota bacterium]